MRVVSWTGGKGESGIVSNPSIRAVLARTATNQTTNKYSIEENILRVPPTAREVNRTAGFNPLTNAIEKRNNPGAISGAEDEAARGPGGARRAHRKMS